MQDLPLTNLHNRPGESLQIVGAGPMPPVWLAMWSLLLSLPWLVPNHYRPWSAFHADAIAASVMSIGCVAIMLRCKPVVEWNGVTLLMLLSAFIPWIQASAGLIPFSGQAWITTAYLLGLLLAVLTGQLWERARTDQCVDAVFLAIGIGCIVSVWLQLYTWLRLNDHGLQDIWSMGMVGERAYANIGQPNQLATLLLWGVLAAAWGYQNRKIGGPVTFLAAAFLLLGVAMTLSRTAWLALCFMLGTTWIWRSRWPSRWVPWAALALFAIFWIYPIILKELSSFLFSGPQPNYLRVQFQDETRHVALLLFAKAALARPWMGYGWTEVGVAQMQVAGIYPGLGMAFGHSHNLFLDLILWLGIPIGGFVAFAMVASFVKYVRSIKSANDLVLVMFLGVIGIHAMLELPLQYAYFLLPVGMVVGVLNVRSEVKPILISGRWLMVTLWFTATLLLAGIIRDYFRVESSYMAFRFERARIGTLPIGKPPEVIFLTQLREQIRFMRYDFQPGMSEADLAWAMNVANAYPGTATSYKVASALALNDRPREAREWLYKACKITTPEQCDLMRQAWQQDATGNRRIAAVAWPQ